jgi:hypothetical protein
LKQFDKAQGDEVMSQAIDESKKDKGFKLTTDWWAVLTAIAFAVLVRVGVIHKVPW